MELFSIRKIRRICPQYRGRGPLSLAHESMDFIKCRSLVSGSTARIESSESVSLLGCLDPIERWVAIGSSQPMQESPGADPTVEAAGSGRGSGGLPPSAAARWSSSFLELRWSVFDEVCSYRITTTREMCLC
jgi:hypothetical protein